MRNRIIQIIAITMLANCVADAPSMAPTTLEDPIVSATSLSNQVATGLPQDARDVAVAKVLAEHPSASAGEHTVSVDGYELLSNNSGGEVTVRLKHYLPGGKRYDGHIYEVDLVRASNGTWSAPTLRRTGQFSGGVERPSI